MPVPEFLKRVAFETATFLAGDSRGRVRLPVLRGPARGLRFDLDLVVRKESAYFLGKYDLRVLRTLQNVIRPGWTVWDIGTYLGFYSAFFSRLVGPTGAVVVIEPDPRNMERTRGNLRLNSLDDSKFVSVAVGAPKGKIDFLLSEDTNSHIPGAWIGSAHMKEIYRERDRSGTSIQVPCVSPDQLLVEYGLPRPDLVKIDIEGAEVEALQHMGRLCETARPVIIQELHNPECDSAAWTFFTRANYRIHSAETLDVLRTRSEVHGTLLCMPNESFLPAIEQ